MIIFGALIIISCFLTNCNNSDSISGKWIVKSAMGIESKDDKTYMILTDDNTAIEKNNFGEFKRTWSIKGNELCLKASEEDGGIESCGSFKLDGNKLIWNVMEIEIIYQKNKNLELETDLEGIEEVEAEREAEASLNFPEELIGNWSCNCGYQGLDEADSYPSFWIKETSEGYEIWYARTEGIVKEIKHTDNSYIVKYEDDHEGQIIIELKLKNNRLNINGLTCGGSGMERCSLDEKINIPDHVDSDFNIFFKYFNTDSVFQISRVKFPAKYKEFSDYMEIIEKTISQDDYYIKDLTVDLTSEKKKMNAYTQRTVLKEFKAKIEIRGIQNGINLDYEFEKIDGKWNLTAWSDFSM